MRVRGTREPRVHATPVGSARIPETPSVIAAIAHAPRFDSALSTPGDGDGRRYRCRRSALRHMLSRAGPSVPALSGGLGVRLRRSSGAEESRIRARKRMGRCNRVDHHVSTSMRVIASTLRREEPLSATFHSETALANATTCVACGLGPPGSPCTAEAIRNDAP